MDKYVAFRQLIRSAHPYLSCFDYDHYPECFSRFEEAAGPIFRQFTEVSPADADGSRAEEAVMSLSQDYGSMPRREQKEISFRDKQVLALFLVPAAMRAGDAAADFARKFNACWNTKFPRNTFLVGNYETIMKGFDANLLGLPLRKSKKR